MTTRVERYCDLANPAHEAYRPGYAAMLCDEAPATSAAPVSAVLIEPPAVPNNPHVERLLLVLGCDYRTDALDECSCTARRHCSLGKGEFASEPYNVSLSRCLECVSRACPD
jgi:hypothetical protein